MSVILKSLNAHNSLHLTDSDLMCIEIHTLQCCSVWTYTVLCLYSPYAYNRESIPENLQSIFYLYNAPDFKCLSANCLIRNPHVVLLNIGVYNFFGQSSYLGFIAADRKIIHSPVNPFSKHKKFARGLHRINLLAWRDLIIIWIVSRRPLSF